MCEQILKNTAGQVLTYNSKNFHLLNKKLEPERTMIELGKPFLNKSDEKVKKNIKVKKHQKKIKVKMPHVNKKSTNEK